MKVKVLKKFVDSAEKNVLRTVGEEFTVSKERYVEIKTAGDYVEEIKTKAESKKLVKDDDGEGDTTDSTASGAKSS